MKPTIFVMTEDKLRYVLSGSPLEPRIDEILKDLGNPELLELAVDCEVEDVNDPLIISEYSTDTERPLAVIPGMGFGFKYVMENLMSDGALEEKGSVAGCYGLSLN